MNFYGNRRYMSFHLILVGILTLIYYVKIINFVEWLIFKNDSIAAFTFTFSKLIFFPISLCLAYITPFLVLLVVQKLRCGAVNNRDKSWVLKLGYLFIAVLIATIAIMQCRTTVYKDGDIVSKNYIEKLSPQYTAEDYRSVVFYGESLGSAIPNRTPRIYFYFDLTFFIDEDTYVEFHPENFRDYETLYNLGQTLGDKLIVWPEEGFSPNDIANMSESDYDIYKMMYKGVMPSDDIYEDITEDEDETEQEHYAFDGYYDF